MTVKAYHNAQLVTENPRATEYRLFGKITGALIEAQKNRAKLGPLAEVLDWNKQLWRTLANDCLDDRNQLPKDVRAKIVSLSLWVAKYSKTVTREGAPLDPLIQVNRTIMQGLQDAA
jgi:flagellar protein FlaF